MRRTLVVLVAVVTAVVVGSLVWVAVSRGSDGSPTATPSPSSGPSEPSLFGPAPAATFQPPDTSLGTPRRSRYVTFRADLLPATAAGQELSLDLFEDAEFVGTVQRIDRQPLLTSWSGPLGAPNSDFVITQAGGRYQVTASTPQGVFTMSMTRAGFYQVVEVGQQLPIDSGAPSPSP